MMRQSSPGSAGGQVRDRSPSQEHALFEYVERLERHRAGRIAVHIHLSRLQAHNRRDQYIRVATTTFEELVKQFEGQIFILRNTDIIFVAKGATMAQIDEAVQKLRYLFSEDPLTQYGDDGDTWGFSTWYHMETDYREFLEMARQSVPTFDPQAEARAEKARVPLGPAQLGRLEEVLGTADLSNVMRNQTVCTIFPKMPPQAVFHEIYVSIADLQKTVTPGIDLTANRWLFQYLTQTLDRRVLAILARDSSRTERAFSVNLNVATLLSPEFQRFDQVVAPHLRGRLVIELQKVDIFEDMGAFMFARDFIRERGYKLCLDGLTHMTLPFIDREKLGFDLIKVYWSPEFASSLKPGLLDGLKAQVARAEHARVILCRCDSEQAIEVGRQMGIAMFQGRYVDKLVAASRNTPPGQKG